jgi:hypothetical protein
MPASVSWSWAWGSRCSWSGLMLCLRERCAGLMSRLRLYLSMLLIASSASRSYHSRGAELGDGIEAMLVSGESNASSGDCAKSCEPTSFGTTLANPGDMEVGALLCIEGDGVIVASDPVASGLFEASAPEAYKHSLSDFVHIAHRGLCSSHLTLLLRQVRLFQSAQTLQLDLHHAPGCTELLGKWTKHMPQTWHCAERTSQLSSSDLARVMDAVCEVWEHLLL